MATVLALALVVGMGVSAKPAQPKCADSKDLRIFLSPLKPHKRAPMKALIVSETSLDGLDVVAIDPDGVEHPLTVEALGGPPYGLIAQVAQPTRGRWQLEVRKGADRVACKRTRVGHGAVSIRWLTPKPAEGEALRLNDEGQPIKPSPTWRARWRWEADTEALYSLWIAHLFRAPPGQDVSWKPLHELLRDAERNLLHNHLNMREDSDVWKKGLVLRPDCADFPYFLRGYFAWKNSLPFVYRACRRGRKGKPPTCLQSISQNRAAEHKHPVRAFEHLMRKEVARTVHSSTMRTLPADEVSDVYPVALTRNSLRPGTVYSDPQGHIMVVTQWVEQEGDRAGVLFAADAQPDFTVGRRRFWRGSFMFPADGVVSGAGFKRFRPLVRRGGRFVTASNKFILEHPDYGDLSLAQWENGRESFYDQMDALISPEPLSANAAQDALIDALDQQLRRRIASVENGEGWKRDHPGREIAMPKGGKIFLTVGPWEDFSTPARDLRLLIAMDTVLGFGARVERLPGRYRLADETPPAAARAGLEARLGELAATRSFTYVRSDGSDFTLTMAAILERVKRFEFSWNPNACIEERWGARAGDPDYGTCQAQVPDAQRERMVPMRPWFVGRERPSDG
jgi:hypothetical protein